MLSSQSLPAKGCYNIRLSEELEINNVNTKNHKAKLKKYTVMD